MTTPTEPTVTGRSIIAGEPVAGDAGTHRPLDPRTGEELDPPFMLVGEAEVDTAARAAAGSADALRAVGAERRAAFLEAIADELEAAGDTIVTRACRESGLPKGRIEGELARTTGQLRLFAKEVRLGAFHGIRHDPPLPDRTPAPRPDLRLRRIPIGPVVVFGASNFPLAFSTAGGDTASALAAGCPVIVKGHSAHSGTAELAGQAIVRAAERTEMPPGVFSLLFGAGNAVGQALARHPDVAAVAFTGSRSGGTALMATAAARPAPIPVFAEMSSINPVIVAPGAASSDAETLAEGFVGSLTLGAGQFCTNPGLLFLPADATPLSEAISRRVAEATGQTMLTPGIRAAYDEGLGRLREHGAEALASGVAGEGDNAPAPAVSTVTADVLAKSPQLAEEVFGPAALIVTYESVEELAAVLVALGGQLTATVHIDGGDADDDVVRCLLPVLERTAGRLVVNGWPTGVEVVDAMVHGGPFPATSDARSTSVGTLAIDRFLRPVAYQGFPERLLPDVFLDPALPVRRT